MIPDILIARWQCYQYNLHGFAHNVKSLGPLFKIHPSGQVDFAYLALGKWVVSTELRQLGQFKIITSSYYELELSVGGIITYYCKRLP